MKKKLLKIITMLCICMPLIGCTRSEESLNGEIVELEAEITQLKSERDSLKNEIVEIKVDNGTAKYIVTFNIRQVHYSLNIDDHIKDAMNDISIQIPVDKEYYDSVEVGQIIDESFRVGSMIMKGSFGSWRVSVAGKEIL